MVVVVVVVVVVSLLLAVNAVRAAVSMSASWLVFPAVADIFVILSLQHSPDCSC